MKYIDLRITAISDEDLKDFLLVLRKIQYCGDIGGNRKLPLQIDGDGSGQIDIEIHDKKIETKKLTNLKKIIYLDKSKLEKVNDGYDFDTHYIGE